MDASIGAVVMAAGKGTRMHAGGPKVLRRLLGEPMLGYVLGALSPLFQDRVRVVVGHCAGDVETSFPDFSGRFVLQEPQLGTGHAVQCAWPEIKRSGWSHVLVINGDVPQVTSAQVTAFVAEALDGGSDLAFLSIEVDDPGAYGRVCRDTAGRVRIVEAKDHDPVLHGPASGEINAGAYLLKVSAVERALAGLTNANASQEFYITDLVELVGDQGGKVSAVNRGREQDLLGINTPAELVEAEEALRARIVKHWLLSGVTVRSPGQVRIGPRVRLEPGAEVCGPCDLVGDTTLGAGCVVGPSVWIEDSRLGTDCKVLPFSHLQRAELKAGSDAGPFARLRPGAVLEEKAHVGNFVEMKKATLGVGAKAGHLTYLGDATVGSGANVGAGTITCNYDGAKKWPTVIGEDAFIGSNTALVAPVTVGAGAVVGAGSVITKNVPDKALAVTRGKLFTRVRK
ncbi:bifunctional UDP-N-acetylglucosamine diphosphorylase/glucosamine-1-phosphate N-acetyltransferase GlmU [Fundidesulfovibrio butyratiphilus]